MKEFVLTRQEVADLLMVCGYSDNMALNSRLQGIRFRMVDYLLETKK
jgi:hypothetical protein